MTTGHVWPVWPLYRRWQTAGRVAWLSTPSEAADSAAAVDAVVALDDVVAEVVGGSQPPSVGCPLEPPHVWSTPWRRSDCRDHYFAGKLRTQITILWGNKRPLFCREVTEITDLLENYRHRSLMEITDIIILLEIKDTNHFAGKL